MIINGVDREMEQCHVSVLIERLGFQNDRIVIEVNGSVITKENYGSHWLNGDEKVEIVRFVGGG